MLKSVTIQSESEKEPRMATMMDLFLWSVTSANGVWQTPLRNEDIWRSLGLSLADAKNAAVFFQSQSSPSTSRVLEIYFIDTKTKYVNSTNAYMGKGKNNVEIRSRIERTKNATMLYSVPKMH